jgi:hypothetical protein
VPGSHGHERLDPEHLAVAPHGLELVAGRRGIAAKPRRRVALEAESLVSGVRDRITRLRSRNWGAGPTRYVQWRGHPGTVAEPPLVLR